MRLTNLKIPFLMIPVVLLSMSCGFKKKPNIIIIQVDSLNIDFLYPWNNEGGYAPAIDALAKESLVFRHAFTPCPLELPAAVTLFTGTYPQSHLALSNDGYYLPHQWITLTEILKKTGYTTYGVSGSRYIARSTGISKGFMTFDDNMLHRPSTGNPLFNLPTPLMLNYEMERRPSEDILSLAERFIRQEAKPLFLYMHISDLTQPYRNEPIMGKEAYLSMLKEVDANIGRFLQFLKDIGKYKNSCMILMSGNGESLGGEMGKGHGYNLTETTIHVPLIIKEAGGSIKRAGKYDTWVSLVDIAPTILEIAGIHHEKFSRQTQGISLMGFVKKKNPKENPRSLFGKTALPEIEDVGMVQRMILEDPFMLVFTKKVNQLIPLDEGEEGSYDREKELRRLLGQYKTFSEETPGDKGMWMKEDHQSQEKEYLPYKPEIWRLYLRGKLEEGIEKLSSALSSKDEPIAYGVFLADLLQSSQDMEGAKKVLKGCIQRNDRHFGAWEATLRLFLKTGDVGGMKEALVRMEPLFPDNPILDQFRLYLFLVEKDFENFKNLLEKSLKKYGPLPPFMLAKVEYLLSQEDAKKKIIRNLANLKESCQDGWLKAYLEGLASDLTGNEPKALKAYIQAADTGATYYRCYLRAGKLTKKEGKFLDAQKFLKAAMLLSPGDLEPLYEWADLMAAMGQWEASRDAFSQLLQLEPSNFPARFALMKVHWLMGEKEKAHQQFQELVKSYGPVLERLQQKDPIFKEIVDSFHH